MSSSDVNVPDDIPDVELQEFEKWCKLRDKINSEKLKRSTM